MNHNLDDHAINQGLLQSYRSIFISSQSFFLAIGALLYNKNIILTASIGILCLIQIWWIWFRVVYSRAKIVDYHKFKYWERYSMTGDIIDQGQFITEDEYVTNSNVRKRILHEEKRKTFRATRIKLDIVLPIIFSIIWILFIVTDIIMK